MSVAAYGGSGIAPISDNPFLGTNKINHFDLYVPNTLAGKALTALYLTFYNNIPNGVFEFYGAEVIRYEQKDLPTGYTIKQIVPTSSVTKTKIKIFLTSLTIPCNVY